MTYEIKWVDLVHFTPKQLLAEQAVDKYKYILYGGSVGGGKSFWLRWMLVKLLFQFGKQGLKGVRVGLFCEDYPALKDRHLSKVQYEFPSWLGTLNRSDYEFTLSPEYGSGVICFRNLDDPSKYQSSEFAVIAVDELTKDPKEVFDFLRTRMRWANLEQTKFLAGTNPGGIGHAWVKDLWFNHKFEPGEQEKDLFYFIPARATDNPNLPESYYLALAGLPEKMRKAYVDGNWDIFEGMYFTEWDRNKHIEVPFKIPESWQKFRSIDPSGRSGITSCHWYALDNDGKVHIYREYYRTGLDSDQHADEIKRLSGDEEYRYTTIDTAAYSKLGLPETTVEIYERHRVSGLVPSMKNRVMGWDIMHQYLRWSEWEPPKLRVFDVCTNFIRTIPNLIHDELHPEDVDTNGEDHAADECRYLLQTLREKKTPQSLSIVEQRLQQLKEQEEMSFNYRKI